MNDSARRRTADQVLDASEAGSPVQTVEAVTRELGIALGATSASFLIADLSGRGLVQLAHVPLADGPEGESSGRRRLDEEFATSLPFDGGPAEQAVRTQQVQVLAPSDPQASDTPTGEWRVLAPVTERGDSIGLLEL